MGLWLPHCALLVVQSGWPKEVTKQPWRCRCPPRAGDSACCWSYWTQQSTWCMGHTLRVPGWGPLQQHRVGQDRWPPPHPSSGQFYFQPHAHVRYVSSPNPASNQGYWLRLGWSLCFCTEQCKWMLVISGQELPCLSQPTLGTDRPICTYTPCVAFTFSDIFLRPGFFS